MKLTAVQRDIITDKNRFRAVAAGRRTGKTVEAAYELAVHASNSNSRLIYVAPTYDQAKRIMWNLLKQIIPISWISVKNESSPQRIELKNGSVITLHGAGKFDTLRGEGYDFVVLDEVADMEPEIFYEVLRPALSDKQGKALFIGTPKGKSNWFYEIMNNDIWSRHSYTTLQGGLVPEEEIESAKSEHDERTFKQEYEASFESYSGAAYYTFTDDNIVDIQFNPTANTYLCWDFNIGDRPMSCIVVQNINGTDYVTKEFVHKYSNTAGTVESVNQYFKEKGLSGTLTVTGDYAGHAGKSSASMSDYLIIENTFKNYSNYNQRTRPTRSIRDRVAALNARFCALDGVRRLFVSKECKALINDLRLVEWKDNNTQLDDRDPERTHPTDALSYYAYNFYPIQHKREYY